MRSPEELGCWCCCRNGAQQNLMMKVQLKLNEGLRSVLVGYERWRLWVGLWLVVGGGQ